MGELVGQVWEIRAGDQAFEGLDIRAVARWPKTGAGSVDVVINHAGPVLRGIVDERSERISILAGYQRDQGAVEIGGGQVVADSISLDRASPDRPFEFQLSTQRRVRQVRLSAAFEAVSASELIEYIRTEAGLAGTIELGQDVTYSRYSFEGSVSKSVSRLAADTGSEWDIDGDTLVMWPATSQRRITADVWSVSTGLMRVSGTADEIRARAMLRPALRPGDVLRIEDEGYSGDVRVIDAVHEIDTYGGTWATTITGEPR